MKTRMILILIVVSQITLAQFKPFEFQSRKDKRLFAVEMALFAVSGFGNGMEQKLAYHYSAFKRQFPNANESYWNPNLSWKNKYKNGKPELGAKYFGSTTFLVFTTDGKHMLDIVAHVPLYFGVVIPLCNNEQRKISTKAIILRYITLVGVNSIMNNISYN